MRPALVVGRGVIPSRHILCSTPDEPAPSPGHQEQQPRRAPEEKTCQAGCLATWLDGSEPNSNHPCNLPSHLQISDTMHRRSCVRVRPSYNAHLNHPSHDDANSWLRVRISALSGPIPGSLVPACGWPLLLALAIPLTHRYCRELLAITLLLSLPPAYCQPSYWSAPLHWHGRARGTAIYSSQARGSHPRATPSPCTFTRHISKGWRGRRHCLSPPPRTAIRGTLPIIVLALPCTTPFRGGGRSGSPL